MFGHNFYFGTTRKCIIYFGNLFNDTEIYRYDTNGNVTQIIQVPLTYAPKDKMMARVNQDPALDKEAAITLPRMSFVLKDFQYDGDRHLNPIGKVVRKDDTNVNKFLRQYNPVAYNLHFSLYVYVKNAEDGTKIIDGILPFFTPEWNATLNLLPEMDLMVDIPVVLTSVSSEDHYDGSFVNRRAIVWTLDFVMKSYYFGPIVKKPIIKFANTNFYFGNPNENDVSDIVGNITVTPGLLANGSPTTNSELSISPLLIDVEDDWDYAIQNSGIVIIQ